MISIMHGMGKEEGIKVKGVVRCSKRNVKGPSNEWRDGVVNKRNNASDTKTIPRKPPGSLKTSNRQNYPIGSTDY